MASIRRYKSYFDYFSGRAKYLLIHIPKNAGVAIKRSPVLGGRLVGAEPWFYRSGDYRRRMLRTMKENGEHHGLHHARLRDIHPRVRRRLQPVAVVRNPWSRVVSRYRFACTVMASLEDRRGYASQSFEEFLEERHLFGGREFYWHRAVRGWFPQHDYVVDEAGRIETHLLRHERLGEEAMRYFGLPEPIRRRNVSAGQRKPYREYYTARTIQIVADWYAKDIEVFGFDFDTPARRNCFYDLQPRADAA